MTDTFWVDQPAGLGDIFFVQGICAHYRQEGHRVLHPVHPMMWANGAKQVVSEAEFGPQGTLDIPAEAIHLGLSNQPRKTPYDVMQSKYEGLGLDWSNWADHFRFNRNPEAERAIAEANGVADGQPFILFNINYGLGHHGKTMTGPVRLIPDGWDGAIVNMTITDSVFDWCWMFENAYQIHSVDTCIQYIIEKLDVGATRMTVHPRHYARTKLAVGSLWKQPWEWVDYERDDWRSLAPLEAE